MSNKKSTSIYIKEETLARAKELAYANNMPLSVLVSSIIEVLVTFEKELSKVDNIPLVVAKALEGELNG